MILESNNFVFEPPTSLSRARRILIKPFASSGEPYPHSVSAGLIRKIIEGIRKKSDADVVVLEGSACSKSMKEIYQDLKYSFPRILFKDIREVSMVEVDNPLGKPLFMPTFQVPNVILSSDYLISVAPLRIIGGQGFLTIPNLMSLISCSKQKQGSFEWELSVAHERAKILTDLYYTIPFDLGIVEASEKLVCKTESAKGDSTNYGRIFMGEPYQVDREVVQTLGIKADYLKLIDDSRSDLDI